MVQEFGDLLGVGRSLPPCPGKATLMLHDDRNYRRVSCLDTPPSSFGTHGERLPQKQGVAQFETGH
jgi:hypothetical protein